MVLAFMNHLISLSMYHGVGFYESSHLIGVYIRLLAIMSPLIPLGISYGVSFYEPPNPIVYI